MNILRFAPRFSGTAAAVEKYCARTLRVPEAVELVYLPFVLFKYSIKTAGYGGKRKTSFGLFLVDLIQGTPMNIRAGTVFSVEESAAAGCPFLTTDSNPPKKMRQATLRVGAEDVPALQIIPALLDSEEAIARGKRQLRYDLMRLAGGLRYKTWELVIHPERAVIHYPYWLAYNRNRRGIVQLGVIDGLNGQREGGEVAASIEMGLLEMTNEKTHLCSRA